MLFNVSLQSSGVNVTKLVSGSTWTECSAWAEGTGDSILSITNQQQNLILNNPSSDESYVVGLKDVDTLSVSATIIYDTYANVSTWINAQSGKTLQSIQYTKRTFVQL